ncbi:Bug family tripartite tricarboxylate transporter substrate binding protein [Crenalkalicoccus roseus]|uniref:Bug family tripartite tricarboxylate transporter substrate binding protein n=1 Tax=Crenalkalicoccus roseus TaxID=1485588 RepID=UPI0013053355|nr:tripartite tricarboxylate transporter substrate binding protein [Crenalkalicoccus roseus]
MLDRRALLGGAALLPFAARAQTQPAWRPQGPVRIIVPFPPGGTVDPIARLVQPHLQQMLGQPIVIDNRPGAGGTVGTALAARAAPDGQTFLFVFDTHAVNPFLMPNLPYDTKRDLAPLMLIGTAPNVIATGANKPWRTGQELIEAARARPNTIACGSIGNGSLGHLTLMLMQEHGNVRLIHVPYRGGGPATADAIGGHIDTVIGSLALIAPHAAGGALRPLIQTGAERSPLMPEVPTLGELGIPNVVSIAFWGALAPAGTPQPALEGFHAALARALRMPEVERQLTEMQGMRLVVSSPEEFGRFLDEQMEQWGAVVRRYNIRPD